MSITSLIQNLQFLFLLKFRGIFLTFSVIRKLEEKWPLYVTFFATRNPHAKVTEIQSSVEWCFKSICPVEGTCHSWFVLVTGNQVVPYYECNMRQFISLSGQS